MGKLMKCNDCKKKISKKSKVCPQCGCPVKKKTSRVAWLFLIFVVLLVYGVTTTEENTTSPSAVVAKEKTVVKPVDSLKVPREKVQSLFQSKSEPTAKDAVWTSNRIFKVGVIDDGTLRDGYASYICEVLYGYGFKGKDIWVQVIDIVELTQKNDWVKLGESHCL